MALTPRRVRELRAALVEFHNAYVAYLEATADQRDLPALRARVARAVPEASRALNAAGAEPAMYPPPAFGGLVHKGLINVVFLHERPGGWGGDSIKLVLDSVQLADATLEKREQALRRQRFNPLYWGDRFLRATLGFPAYLISLLFGVSLGRIEESPFGPVLRVASLAIQTIGVFVAGRAAGVW